MIQIELPKNTPKHINTNKRTVIQNTMPDGILYISKNKRDNHKWFKLFPDQVFTFEKGIWVKQIERQNWTFPVIQDI